MAALEIRKLKRRLMVDSGEEEDRWSSAEFEKNNKWRGRERDEKEEPIEKIKIIL